MKHLSWSLTVLLLGAVPLTAAALDYGPNRPLLAVENGTPPLPGANARTASMDALPKPDAMDASADGTPDASPAVSRVTPSTSSPPVTAAPRGHGPSASNKPRSTTKAKPTAEPDPAATWQSLLPGSIQ